MNDATTTVDPELEVIFTPEAIAERLNELAHEIAGARLENLLVVAILKGSFVFAADLIRALHRVRLAPEVDFMTLSSYRKAQDFVRPGLDPARHGSRRAWSQRSHRRRRSGFRPHARFRQGSDRRARCASIRTCVLLDKQLPRAVNLEPDYYAFLCPNEFVVGYGMDVAHRYRELPFVGRVVRQ